MTSLATAYEKACDEAAVRPNSALARCLAVTNVKQPLQVLDLSANLLGPRGLTALLPVLRECRHTLHSLDLSRNELDSASVRQLAHFFSRGGFTALRHVELRGNPFTYQAGKQLVHWCDGTQPSHVRNHLAGMWGTERNASTTSSPQEGSADLWHSTPTASTLFCASERWCEETEVHVDYIGIEDTLMPPGLIKALQGRIADAVARREHRRARGTSRHRSDNSERLGLHQPTVETVAGEPVPHAPLRSSTSAAASFIALARADVDVVAGTDTAQSSALVGETVAQDADADATPAFLQDPAATTTDAEVHDTTTTTTTATPAANGVDEAAVEALPAFLADSTDGNAPVAATAAPPTAPPAPPSHSVGVVFVESPTAVYDDATSQGSPLATSGVNNEEAAAVMTMAAAAFANAPQPDPLATPLPLHSDGAASSSAAARMRPESSTDTAPYFNNSEFGPLGTGTRGPPSSPTSSSAEAASASDAECDVGVATGSQSDRLLPPELQLAVEAPHVAAAKTASDILDELEMPAAAAEEDPNAPPPWLMEG